MNRPLTDHEQQNLLPFIQEVAAARAHAQEALNAVRHAETRLERVCSLVAGPGHGVDLNEKSVFPLDEKVAQTDEAA